MTLGPGDFDLPVDGDSADAATATCDENQRPVAGREAAPPEARAQSVVVGIQYLRGIAAVLVAYFHTKIYLPSFHWDMDRSFGYGGVDIFFVISGFIMTITNSPVPRRPIGFLISRARRIYPPYWVALTASFLMFAIYPAAFQKEGVDLSYILSSYTLFPIQNRAGVSDGVPFLKIGWTLVFEVFFYVMFAITLLVRSGAIRLLLQATFFAAMIGYGLACQPRAAALLFYTSPMSAEFIFGCAVAWCIVKRVVRPPRWVLLLLLFGVCLPAYLMGGGESSIFMRVLSFGLPAAGIVFCVAQHDVLYGAIVDSRWLRLLGDASFSIYLAHPFVLTALRIVADGSRLPFDAPALGAAGVCVAVGACVVIGVLAYFFVERPSIALADQLLRHLRGVSSRTARQLPGAS